jgi:hypothetical protein
VVNLLCESFRELHQISLENRLLARAAIILEHKVVL